MLGWCEKCVQLIEITPTDRPVGRTGTARRWRIVMHPTSAPAVPDSDGDLRKAICDGSGDLI